MKIKIYYVILIMFFLFASNAYAAKIHLNSGESLSGKIQGMDDQTLSLESDRGFGVLQIDKADMRLIEFDGNQRDLSRKFGLGYYQKNPVAEEFSIGSASLKYWLNSTDAVDMLIGYGGTIEGGDKLEEIFSLEVRFTKVVLQEGNHDVYWGGGLGFISVTDEETRTDDTGITLRGLLGVEFFFVSYPNLGVSAELGVSNQTVGDRTSMGVFSAGFPTMAVRYYF
ncbi:MAG: hypothetical protein HQM14_01930 [SAR324 cluster bacterium]|nr:hypothetical protein [SAR324 cluster bacterium]